VKIPDLRILTLTALCLFAAQATTNASPQSPEGQDESSGSSGFFTERVDVRVVNVDVVVTNRAGQSITGLTKADFDLRVDGKTIPIANFYSEKGGFAGQLAAIEDRPAVAGDSQFTTVEEADAGASRRTHVVVMIDHTRLSKNNRKRTFKAMREAIDGFDSEDLISFVGVEGGSLVFYSDFLYDRTAAHKILDSLDLVSVQTDIMDAERRLIFGELARGISGGIQARASQAESDVIRTRIRAYAEDEYARGIASMRQIETVISTLNGVPGRKALLYVGEGIPTRPGEGLYVELRNRFATGGNPSAGIGMRRFDFNTDYTREIGRFDLTQPMIQLAKAANRANVTMYAIDAEGDHGGIARSALTEQGATSETLSVIDANFRAPLEAVTQATGGRLLRSAGTLADQLLDVVGDLQTYYSLGFEAPEDWADGSDHNIEVKVRGEKLRVSYREAIRIPQADEREASATIAALMYQTANNPLKIQATTGESVKRDDGNAAVPIDLAVPIEKLGFLPLEKTQSGSLTIYVCTKDADGNPGKVQKIPFHIELPNEVMEQAMKDSARYPLPIVLRPGDQQVAIGVRDNVNGIFSAIRLDVSELSRL